MAPACAETLRNHLHDFACNVDDYDLILTGDLSTYGVESFKKMVKTYGITLGDNYKDSGLMLYDIEKQNVHAGGSGCGCVSLVTLGYVVKQMYENKLNKVLIIATGALMNPIMVAQKETIPAIAHAIVLERVK
jgi:stage V sporulation protein AD